MSYTVYSLYIINKSGGLIYSKDYTDVAKCDLNDIMRLGSIWHSLHAIASQLSPMNGCTGIELLEADTFDLHCFQSLTGTKFLLVVEPQTPYISNLLHRMYKLYCDYVLKNPCHALPAVLPGRIYELYGDYVLKNPFYEVEQPIKCELFDENVEATVRKYPGLGM